MVEHNTAAGKRELALANINRTTVFTIMAGYARTSSQAQLIISGLITEEEDQLKKQCWNLGLAIGALRREEEWLCAVVGRS
ncbi:MAG: 50S ribosomal protein L11 methyltransferase [Candidatus Neomarinimicrobiota bacterium]